MKGVLSKLHPKNRFESYPENERFERKIKNLIIAGEVEEISVDTPEHPFLEEHWYQDMKTEEIYRYCPPEFPARGVWEKVVK